MGYSVKCRYYFFLQILNSYEINLFCFQYLKFVFPLEYYAITIFILLLKKWIISHFFLHCVCLISWQLLKFNKHKSHIWTHKKSCRVISSLTKHDEQKKHLVYIKMCLIKFNWISWTQYLSLCSCTRKSERKTEFVISKKGIF